MTILAPLIYPNFIYNMVPKGVAGLCRMPGRNLTFTELDVGDLPCLQLWLGISRRRNRSNIHWRLAIHRHRGEPYRPSQLIFASISNLRSFPNGTRNCYTLSPVQSGDRYLIRAGFLYGNYDGRGSPPIFDLHIGYFRDHHCGTRGSYTGVSCQHGQRHTLHIHARVEASPSFHVSSRKRISIFGQPSALELWNGEQTKVAIL
ncbi:unnamed protein product [Spirodela intermedia]|uniref:Malectin-like domain-containing protein n=1 Tax=Spirodela intermedia TaxID=51605 RepID=A0A7I8JCQ1_SPIIN|nr:unnamed protein product [Spirodela intermedia]CAA6667505.1 unnamed protein product [Spirodela intermedia]